MLADVRRVRPGVAAVRNGYLRSSGIAQPAAFARALDERFEAIAVGRPDRRDLGTPSCGPSDQVVACLHTELSIVVDGRNLGAELPPAEPRAAPRAGAATLDASTAAAPRSPVTDRTPMDRRGRRPDRPRAG